MPRFVDVFTRAYFTASGGNQESPAPAAAVGPCVVLVARLHLTKVRDFDPMNSPVIRRFDGWISTARPDR
jgi:hypothetical protein